jgi:hypothetical protein
MDQLNHYLRPPTRTLPRLVASIAAMGLLAGIMCFAALKLRTTAARTELRSEQLSAAQVVRPEEKKSHGVLEEQRRWAVLKAERDFSWAEIFSAVEKAGNADIELLEFKPDKGNRRVLLGGEARDQQSLMVFLDALAEQANFKNVHLTHQQRKKRDRIETVSFEIRASISD